MPTEGHVLSAHAHNWLVWVGKGRQQINDVLLLLQLSDQIDANAARGVCALESSSFHMHPLSMYLAKGLV